MALEENNWVPAAIFGGSLVLLVAGMMFGHARTWKEQKSDGSLADLDRQYLRNRYLDWIGLAGLADWIGWGA